MSGRRQKKPKLIANREWQQTLWEKFVLKPMRKRKERHTARNLAKGRSHE